MSILHKLESVHYIKNFDGKRNIPEEHITELLKVSSMSGTSEKNDFEIIVVHNKEKQKRLNDFVGDEIMLEKASHLFVFSLNNIIDTHEKEIGIEQIYMSLGSVVLAAQDFNIDIFLLEKLDEKKIIEVLELESLETNPFIVLSLGYREDNKQIKNKKHKDLDEIVQLRY